MTVANNFKWLMIFLLGAVVADLQSGFAQQDQAAVQTKKTDSGKIDVPRDGLVAKREQRETVELRASLKSIQNELLAARESLAELRNRIGFEQLQSDGNKNRVIKSLATEDSIQVLTRLPLVNGRRSEVKNRQAIQIGNFPARMEERQLFIVDNRDAGPKDVVAEFHTLVQEREPRRREHQDREHQEREHQEREHQERERQDREHQEREHQDREHQEREHQGREHQDRERQDRERQERDHMERERQDRERQDRERQERDHMERERQYRERQDRERQEREHQGREHQEREHQGREHQGRERQERDHMEREHMEREGRGWDRGGNRHPDPAPQQLQMELERFRDSANLLDQLGRHEIADQLRREADQLEQEFNHRDRGQPDDFRQHVEREMDRMRAEIQQLSHHVDQLNRMRKQIDDLSRHVDRLSQAIGQHNRPRRD